MLASTVSRDPDDENFVHDVRIFADGASYAAHVDKSNVELTKAMDSWFGNYDTSVPHTGALFTVGDGNTGKTQRWVPPAQEKVRSEAPTNEALGHRRTIHAVELDQGQAGEACLQSVPLLPRWDGWQAAVAALARNPSRNAVREDANSRMQRNLHGHGARGRSSGFSWLSTAASSSVSCGASTLLTAVWLAQWKPVCAVPSRTQRRGRLCPPSRLSW